MKIDIPRMIVGLRRKLTQERGQPWLERLILRGVLANPRRFDAMVGYARLAQKTFLPKAKSINIPFSGLTSFRDLPTLADKPLSERVPEVSPAKGKKRGTVVFYPGCIVDYVYPEIGEAVVDVLTNLRWEVRLPEGRGCCGIPALFKGDADTARDLAQHNVNIADFQSAEHVVTVCP
ncbi:MAG: (Fe-S)-binding protein, partial [Gemmatimonadales bacterium]|nr:(Fe-S)-binding protein [Gemmatimonadales bacterium]